MTASVTLRVYTGNGAATESSAQTGFTFTNADALSGGSVAHGTNSFERWVRLAIDNPGTSTLTTFSFRGAPDLPDGVTVLYGVSDVGVTPVNTTSLIATKTLGSERVIWDVNEYDTAGDRTKRLVFQLQAASGAVLGAIPQEVVLFQWQQVPG